MKDKDGRTVPNVGRLLGFTVVCVVLGVVALFWGASKGGAKGVEALVAGVVLLACMAILWTGAAMTQWKRRNLEPPD